MNRIFLSYSSTSIVHVSAKGINRHACRVGNTRFFLLTTIRVSFNSILIRFPITHTFSSEPFLRFLFRDHFVVLRRTNTQQVGFNSFLLHRIFRSLPTSFLAEHGRNRNCPHFTNTTNSTNAISRAFFLLKGVMVSSVNRIVSVGPTHDRVHDRRVARPTFTRVFRGNDTIVLRRPTVRLVGQRANFAWRYMRSICNFLHVTGSSTAIQVLGNRRVR